MVSQGLLARFSGRLEQLFKIEDDVASPSLKMVLGFWIVTNVTTIVWWKLELPDRYLPGNWRYFGLAVYGLLALMPIGLLLVIRRSFLHPLMLGLLVSCCLALSITAHEANLLRGQMQFSLDHEREFAHMDIVEGIIRPLISDVVEVYVRVMGDDHVGRSTFRTHIAINYMFDSLSFLAVFSLGTLLLTRTATWLCLFTVAFYAQTAIFAGRMGAVFLMGGFVWQLFLLVSRRYPAAIISGLIISFARTDVVFSTAFVLLSLALFERRWPDRREWIVFVILVGISLAVPKVLISLHPNANFGSFLIMHGDFLGKPLGNIASLKLAIAVAAPFIAIVVVRATKVTRTMAAVVPSAVIYLGIVFLIADFSETRLLGPPLAGLAFVACEALGRLLDAGRDDQPENRVVG